MKRSILLLLLTCLACLAGSAQIKEGASVRELRDLVAPGKKVFVVFEDKTGDIDEKEEYILEYLKEYDQWKLAASSREADFILYVEAYARWTEYSLTSKTYFMTPTIRRKDGTDVWTGETVYDWANLANGLRAVRGVSWKLVARSIKAGLEKELGENRVLLNV